MRILNLYIENVKRLKAVEITPDGQVVVIAGKNDAGKSTVLDAIFWLLAGKAGIQSEPIRRGQTSARIVAKLGDKEVELIVERTLTGKGDKKWTSSVRVMKPNGDVPAGGPQEVLDALLGDLSFDPFAFARMKPAEQFEELRRISKLDVDIAELEKLNAADYLERTNINRDAKAKRASAAMFIVREDLPAEPIDEGELLDAIEEAADVNAGIEREKTKREDARRAIERAQLAAQQARQTAEELRRQAASAEETAVARDTEAAELQIKLKALAPIPAPVDISAIRTRVNEARAINAALASRDRRVAIEAEVVELEKRSATLTENMDARVTTKRNAIASAQLPVPGLGFGDGIVTYEGVPFDQIGTATQTRISVGIAMAANPTLRLILIKDASLLDAETLALMDAMAADDDYQVWYERVADPGKDGTYEGVSGVIIEDGSVRAK